MLVKTKAGQEAEALVPWSQWREICMAEMAGTREYVLRHPFYPVELRVKPLGPRKGTAREWAYPADFQLRVEGQRWPVRWVESRDLIGSLHELCFDATGPRLPEAMESIRSMLERALLRQGIEVDLPDARTAAMMSLERYSGQTVR